VSEKKSGAQNRKEKRDREQADAKKSGEVQKVIDEFAQLGDDPVDLLESLDWMRRLQQRALKLYLRDPDTTLREKFRAVKEMGDSIGKTENRRALESEVRTLREQVGAMMERVAGAKLEPSSAIVKPATARGARGRRGPRPLPGLGAGPSEGED
jgi:hypothetical protein